MPSFTQRYNSAKLVKQCTIDVASPTELCEPFWKLDVEIRKEFDGAVQMYQQGMVHSVEFFEQLQFILNRAR